MNDGINSGKDEQQVPTAPEAPQVPDGPPAAIPQAPPVDNSFDSAGLNDVDLDGSINRGNKGMLIGFLLFLAVAGIVGFLFFKNQQEQQKWENEVAQATALSKKGDMEGFKAKLQSILQKCSDPDILLNVIFTIGEEKDSSAVPLLIKTVEKGGEIGLEAAVALAKIGGATAKNASNTIANQMKKAEGLNKYKLAWVLCSLGDDRGFPTLLEGVSNRTVDTRSIPDYDPAVIAQMGTTEKLIQLASSDDAMLRIYAAMELGFRTDKNPVPALLQLLKDKNQSVAKQAAISLGRTTDQRAGTALLAKMKEAPDLRDPIISAITNSVGAPGLAMVYAKTEDPALKYKIVGKLKKLRDPRSADLLLSITNEEFEGSDIKERKEADKIRNQALWTLEDLGDKRIADKMFAKTLWIGKTEEQIPDPSVRYRQDDMSRKIANGVATWFGSIQPEGAADFLEKMYNANQPYSNTPECAKRVKVDIGPLMDAMGRTKDTRFCAIIKPFLDKDEGFYSQAASMALGRLKCPGIAKSFIKKMQMSKKERKEEKFSTTIEGRDWQMEGRLQERRNAIIATRYLGDPSVGKTLMEIVLDPADDPELRKEASDSIAYVADEELMNAIIEKVNDPAIDIVARNNLTKGLWHNPSKQAAEAMITQLEGHIEPSLIKSASIVIGEAALPELSARLNKLLDNADERRQRGAVFALLLGGNLDRLDRILEILKGQEARLVIRKWYQEHPVYLTQDIFDSKRVYKRLEIADAIMKKTQNKEQEIIWPWKHLMERMKKGWDSSPNGLSALEIRKILSTTVEKDAKYRELAASILAGLNERGFLLALQAGSGDGAKVARQIIQNMNVKSQ